MSDYEIRRVCAILKSHGIDLTIEVTSYNPPWIKLEFGGQVVVDSSLLSFSTKDQPQT